MREVHLSSSGARTEQLIINLTNTETGDIRRLEYSVQKLSGKTAMQAQINTAEYAKDKKRDEIVGSFILQTILAGTHPVGDAPELLSILDELEDDQFVPFIEALVDAAKGSTVAS